MTLFLLAEPFTICIHTNYVVVQMNYI